MTTFDENDKVTGEYYGVKFTGTIIAARPDYSGFAGRIGAMVYTVKTDSPVKTPSDTRSVIMMTVSNVQSPAGYLQAA